jgi:hypothetical protein
MRISHYGNSQTSLQFISPSLQIMARTMIFFFSEDELHRDDQTSHTLTHDKHAEIDFTKELERYIIRSLDEATG